MARLAVHQRLTVRVPCGTRSTTGQSHCARSSNCEIVNGSYSNAVKDESTRGGAVNIDRSAPSSADTVIVSDSRSGRI